MQRDTLILIAVSGLTFFVALGAPAITDSDEAFYAESSREMLESNDWLTPYFNYTTRFEKPVLYYWMVAAIYSVAGPSPWAARIPSAFSGLGIVLVAYFLARRWYGNTTGLLAGTIIATCFGAIGMARQALPDLPLAFFVTLSIWAMLVGVLEQPTGQAETTRSRFWILVVAASAAGAFLVKGPVGIAVPVMVLIPIAIFEYAMHGKWWRARATDLILAAAVFSVIALPWYLLMTTEHGLLYLQRFFFAENIDRFLTARYNAPRSVWYYIPITFAGLLPWSPFFSLWIPRIGRWWSTRAFSTRTLRLAIWISAPLLFYTLSIGKQPRYILPILVPLAILISHSLVDEIKTSTGRNFHFGACGIVVGLIITALGASLYRARPILLEWPDPVTIGFSLAVVCVGIIIASTAAISTLPTFGQRWKTLVIGLVAFASIIIAAGSHTVILASPDASPVERMASMIKHERSENERYGRHRAFDRNLVYYVGAAHVELPVLKAVSDFLESRDRVLCVLRSEDAEALKQNGVNFKELGSVTYLNTGSLTFRTLLNPDPDTYVQRIVLVANR